MIEAGFLADTLFRSTVTSVVGLSEHPSEFALLQNYPNPFNPTTVVSCAVAGLPAGRQVASHVKIAIYDVLGREVAVLIDDYREPGEFNVSWDASGFASGLYICRMTAGSFVDVKRMLLLK